SAASHKVSVIKQSGNYHHHNSSFGEHHSHPHLQSPVTSVGSGPLPLSTPAFSVSPVNSKSSSPMMMLQLGEHSNDSHSSSSGGGSFGGMGLFGMPQSSELSPPTNGMCAVHV